MLLRSVAGEELRSGTRPGSAGFPANALRPHVAPARPVIDRCRCSPDRVAAVLERMSAEELADLVTDAGTIDVTCEFCKTTRSITPPGARH